VFSMGLLASVTLLPAPEDGKPVDETLLGWNVQGVLGIEKYEPTRHTKRQRAQSPFGGNEPDQPWMPRYTDIEGYRRNAAVLQRGEEVVMTEKVHGANGRWAFKDGRLWAGSHNYLRKLSPDCEWWEALYTTGLAEKLSTEALEGLVFYGELYGDVQDLKYGKPGELDIKIFDVYDSVEGRYLDYLDLEVLCFNYEIPLVPILYCGPWDPDVCLQMAEGKTTLGGDHVREGFVVRPVKERWDDRIGRVILKMIGEGYLLRKEA
jgi:RNA ligase (TIGR02306 family)